MITQLRRPRRAQELVAGISDQGDIVGSFLAPDREARGENPSYAGQAPLEIPRTVKHLVLDLSALMRVIRHRGTRSLRLGCCEKWLSEVL